VRRRLNGGGAIGAQGRQRGGHRHPVAALYTPVSTSAIFAPADFGLALLAFLALEVWRAPPWLVVVAGALGATALASVW
jgi:hypothetical protein